MDDRLDALLAQIRAQPLDHSLGAVEGDVRQRRAERASLTGLALPQVRVIAVGLGLIFGTGVGSLTAAAAVAAPRTSLFGSAEALAPSTLLDGHR
jgi:hypothetical protein